MSKVGEIQATLFRQAEEEMERNRKAGDAQDDEVDGEVKSGKAGGKFEFKLLSRNLCHYPNQVKYVATALPEDSLHEDLQEIERELYLDRMGLTLGVSTTTGREIQRQN